MDENYMDNPLNANKNRHINSINSRIKLRLIMLSYKELGTSVVVLLNWSLFH